VPDLSPGGRFRFGRRQEPVPHLVGTPGNPVPPGLVAQRVTARDGRVLRAARAFVARPRGTVLIACGRGDFIERWFETISDLLARDFAVAIFDFRGQGGSSRRHRNRHCDGLRTFREYDDDLAAVMKQVVLPHCPPPFYALGHSTGGLVLLRAIRQNNWFEKVVLSAPLLGVDAGNWPVWLARFLCRLVPALGCGHWFLPGAVKRPFAMDDFPGNPLTSDRRRFARAIATLEAIPELGLGGPTFGWLGAALAAMDELQKAPIRFRTPVLIVAAGRDRVVDSDAARRFAARNGLAFVTIPESEHEILIETDAIRAQFLGALDAFFDRSPGSENTESLLEQTG
jgi:lysophospholipase